jgi:hypothetical protein
MHIQETSFHDRILELKRYHPEINTIFQRQHNNLLLSDFYFKNTEHIYLEWKIVFWGSEVRNTF